MQFVEKMRSPQRTKDMKLQLMRDIALEFSVDRDSKILEQKLFNPTPHDQVSPSLHQLFAASILHWNSIALPAFVVKSYN